MPDLARPPPDLALGRPPDGLRTGDRARIDAEGVVEIVGGLRQFVKVFGLRSDLGRLGAMLADRGVEAECTGDDTGLAVAVLDGTDPDHVRSLVADRIGLPPGAVAVPAVAELPRLPNGKPDRTALRDRKSIG